MADKSSYSLKAEQWSARICGGLACLLYWIFFSDRPFPQSIVQLLSAVLTISAIAIGFMGTAKSILVSIRDRDIVEQLKETKPYGEIGPSYYDIILDYILAGTIWSFALAVVSTIAMLVDFQYPQGWVIALVYVWFFSMGGTLVACARVIYILSGILRL